MIYTFENNELDLALMELRHGDALVDVEPQVFSLICLLLENRDRAVSRDEILEKIWDGKIVSDSALSSRVKSARKAIGDSGSAQRLIRTVRGFGFRFVADVKVHRPTQSLNDLSELEVERSPVEETSDTKLGAMPSIAVLPFLTSTDEPQASLIAGALPQELITALSRLRWLSVIARGSAFQFRGGVTDVREVGALLNVGYCLTGIVDKRVTETVITVELSDTRSGRILWDDQFPFNEYELNEVKDSLVSRIVSAMELHIPMNEANLVRALPESLTAWSEYHLGLQAMYRFNSNDNAAASVHFQRALQLDPGFARAYAGLSFTSFQDAFLNYSEASKRSEIASRDYAQRAVELDPYDAFANFTMGRSYFFGDEYDNCFSWLDRTVDLSPSFAQGHYARGWAAAIFGSPGQSLECVDSAIRLSPLDPLLYAMYGTRAISHIEQQEFEDAAYWGEKGATAPYSHVLLGYIAIVAHGLNGNIERAHFWRDNVVRRRPDVRKELFFKSFPFKQPQTRALFDAQLVAVGL